MPPNPDMSTVMSQMAQMQAAQASSANMLASSLGSIQQTISQMANATQLGVQTAYHGGATAINALQLGAATALGDVAAIGGAIGGGLSALSGPSGPAPAPSMGGLGGAGGMAVGAGSLAYGTSVGALGLMGAVGGYAAWEMTATAMGAGFRGATGAGSGLMAATRMGARIGARTLGGGAASMALGGLIGGGVVAASAIAIPLAASLAIEEAVSTGIQHMGAIRDVSAVLAQQSDRITGFDPNVVTPSAGQFRGLAASIVGDVARAGGVGVGQAAQFISQAGEMGLFAGAADSPGGVRGRARELSEAIKEMTSLLGTSMGEGIAMLGELRQSGITAADAPGAILAERGRARLGGFTGAEMRTAGMRGAQMFRGTGFGPSIGFNAAQNNLAQVSDMVQRGVIDNSLVAAMGGRQAMGEAMTQSQLQFLQGGAGRAFLAAGPQGGMDVLAGRATFAQGALQGIDTSDPTKLAIFLGAQGQIAQRMGPEMIGAGQQRALLEFARRGGIDLQGLSREQQVQALAGLAATPAGQRLLGVQGLDQATLLATQTLEGPASLARQAQAMRIETQREAMLRYNQQNVGFSGAWFKTTTFFNELGGAIGKPFGVSYNNVATAWDDFAEDTGQWWNGQKTEILTKGSVSAISKAAKEIERDPRSQANAVRRVLDPRDIERVRQRANVVTLSGTMQQIHREIKARGLTLLGDAEETFASSLRGGLVSVGTLGGFEAERVFEVEAAQTVQIEAANRQANAMALARIEKVGQTAEAREADARVVDEMLAKPVRLTEDEMKLVGFKQLEAVIGGIDLVQQGEDKDINRFSTSFIRSKEATLAQRTEFARAFFLRAAGGDKKKALLLATDPTFAPPEIQAELARGIAERTVAAGLLSDPDKLNAQFKETAEVLAKTLLGGSSNQQIRLIQAEMDLVAKITDSKSSQRVVLEAARELAKRGAKTGLAISEKRLAERALQVTDEEREELEKAGGRSGFFALAGRTEVAVGREAEELLERSLARPGGRTVPEGEKTALEFVRQFAQTRFTDMNKMVDDLSDTERRNVLRQLTRSPVTRELFEAFTSGDLTDEKSLKKVVGTVEGAQDVKVGAGEQARVEAFQSETLKGFKNINQTTSDLLAISQAMITEIRRIGIGTSK